jgi:hypothetical protein
MLAARVEQKNGMTKDYKKWRDALDKESPIQAVCIKVHVRIRAGGAG